MRRIAWWMIAAMVSVMSGPAWAEEAPAAPAATTDSAPAPAAASDTAPAPSAPAVPAAPAAPVAVAPAPAAPDLKPIVIKFSGEVVQVNKQDAAQPVLTIRDRYGVTKEMASEASAVEALKTGDQVTVEYTYDVATGKRQVQTVSVTQAAAAPAATQ